MMYTDATSGQPAPVTITYDNDEYTIYAHTIGTVVQSNAKRLKTDDGRAAFADKVTELIEEWNSAGWMNWAAEVTAGQMISLHQAVDMLSLINQ